MPTPEQPGLIVRQKSPLNVEFPFAPLSDWLIPTDLFFVRNHFPSPDLNARDWRLRVGGAVERSIELDLDSIKAMRSTTFTAIRQVQVSTGDGKGRREGRLLETERSFAWRLWECMWTPEQVGRCVLRCRAIDAAGRVQPELQRSDCESYAANWIVPVEVAVVPEPPTYEEEFVI